ncbi:MAG TPA: YbhB/YbcL family Raf kinase inhibitor-like protein [Acidimicrobiales bacterium]
MRLGTGRVAATAVALAVAAGPALGLLAACGTDGRELAAPTAGQTTTTAGPTTTAATATGGNAGTTRASVAAMNLSSETLVEGGTIPDRHTCRGADVSPSLLWTNVPPGTAELAIVVRDLDADGFVHWVVAGMPATTGGLAEGRVPPGVEAANGFGRLGWNGPCPPSGTHHYEIRLYALAQPSGVTSLQDGAAAAAQVEATPQLASAALSATVTAL